MKPTEADRKWLSKIVDSDDSEIGIGDQGPYITFKSADYETIKRVEEICKKLGTEGELTFDPS